MVTFIRLICRFTWRPKCFRFWVFVVLAASSSFAEGQSSLESIRRDVQKKDRFAIPLKPTVHCKAKENKRDRGRYSYFDTQDEIDDKDEANELESEVVTFGAMAVGAVATSPFWAPAIMTREPGSNGGRFLSYPYKNRANGNYDYTPPTVSRHHWFSRFRIDYADTFDDVQSFGGQILLDTKDRYGFDTEFRRLEDPSQSLGSDHFWTGDANLLIRFGINDHVQFRAGPGINWLRNSAGSDFGYNLTYAFDWYIADPWIFSFEFDWGEIGHSHLDHLRLQVGWQYKHVESFVGYDYFSLGSTDLHSGIVGLRFWF